MSTSAIGAASAIQIQPHGHHHRAGASASAASSANNLLASADDSTSASATTAPSTTADSSPSVGLQKFAAELQSILISAQSGQKVGSTTASDPATAADPDGATDPSAPSKTGGHAVRHLADRLQDLLASTGGAPASPAVASGTDQPANLQSVLDRLQSTLQQTLQSYGKDAAKTATTSLTA